MRILWGYVHSVLRNIRFMMYTFFTFSRVIKLFTTGNEIHSVLLPSLRYRDKKILQCFSSYCEQKYLRIFYCRNLNAYLLFSSLSTMFNENKIARNLIKLQFKILPALKILIITTIKYGITSIIVGLIRKFSSIK